MIYPLVPSVCIKELQHDGVGRVLPRREVFLRKKGKVYYVYPAHAHIFINDPWLIISADEREKHFRAKYQ